MWAILEILTRTVAAVYNFFFGPDCGVFRDVRFAGDGKRVLVSGCDSGIGLRVAERLHGAGYQVLAGCLSVESDGAKRLGKLKEPHPVQVFPLDVTKQDSVRDALLAAQVPEKGTPECLRTNRFDVIEIARLTAIFPSFFFFISFPPGSCGR